MAYTRRARLFTTISFLTGVLVLFALSTSSLHGPPPIPFQNLKHHAAWPLSPPKSHGAVPEEELSLTEAECSRAFPGLTKEVDDAVALGPFELKFRQGVLLQAKIESGRLYVVRAPDKGDLSDTMRHRQLSALHQLHRAIVTSPEPLPDTAIALAAHDVPIAGSMSYARPALSPSRKRIWPMPHFAYWSWPLPFIGSLPAASRAIAAVEAAVPFAQKKPRAVWRGTPWFNNGVGSNPRLRQDLLAAAKGQPWADVEALEWRSSGTEAANALRIEDFCRYRYIIQTEGIGYSGRLQFHQLCESVLLTPALEWMQHTTHLVRPVFSSTILGTAADGHRQRQHPSARVREAWPVEAPLDEANTIFVAGDWSDLNATIYWLEENPAAAAGLARRQRDMFAGGGYMSPAAEACYWRSLLRGWAKVVRPIGEGWEKPGKPFEEFATEGVLIK
jgi:hypothetical protein